MENHNFENKVKETFEEYIPKLDHDEIWENIEPHLKKKKKRRFFFIWFLGGLLLLGLFSQSNLFVEKEKETNSLPVPTSPEKITEIKVMEDKKEIEPAMTPEPIASQKTVKVVDSEMTSRSIPESAVLPLVEKEEPVVIQPIEKKLEVQVKESSKMDISLLSLLDTRSIIPALRPLMMDELDIDLLEKDRTTIKGIKVKIE